MFPTTKYEKFVTLDKIGIAAIEFCQTGKNWRKCQQELGTGRVSFERVVRLVGDV